MIRRNGDLLGLAVALALCLAGAAVLFVLLAGVSHG